MAQRQGGHVTTAQLLGLGFTTKAIQRQTAAGHLLRVYRGVYAVGHHAVSGQERAHAALLAVRTGSVLSGWSAAALWGLRRDYPEIPELLCPQQRRISGVDVRRCETLKPRDITKRHGLSVTSPARTLLDLGPRVDPTTLERFYNELRMHGWADNRKLRDVARRNANNPGAPLLRRLVGDSQGEAKRSVLEIEWQRFARTYRLPPYVMNVPVAGYLVDVLFTPGRLIVELDGWATHGTRRAYEQDRARDARIYAKTGIHTVRVTHAAFHRRPADQASLIRESLARSQP